MGQDNLPNAALSKARQQASRISRRQLIKGALALAGIELISACESLPSTKPEPTVRPVAPAARFVAVPPTRVPTTLTPEYRATTDREDDTLAVNSQVNQRDFNQIFALPARFLNPSVRSQVDTLMASLLLRTDNVRPNYLELRTVKVVDIYTVIESDGVRQWHRRDREDVVGTGRILVARMSSETKRDEGDLWMRKRDAGNNPGSMSLFLDGNAVLKAQNDQIPRTDPIQLSQKVLISTAAESSLGKTIEGRRLKHIEGRVAVGSETLSYNVNDSGQLSFDILK